MAALPSSRFGAFYYRGLDKTTVGKKANIIMNLMHTILRFYFKNQLLN